MIFNFYYNSEGKVGMYSQGKNIVDDRHKSIELEITSDEYALIQQNYDLFIENNKLVIKKPERLIGKEKNDDKEKEKTDFKDKLLKGKVTNEEIANFLLKIL